jgi:hypothetical protein
MRDRIAGPLTGSAASSDRIVGLDIAESDRVYLSTARSPFVRESFGQLANGAFAG